MIKSQRFIYHLSIQIVEFISVIFQITDNKAVINALSLLGLLSRFVGMLTDSRSFLSYPRHEYFRRTLCNLLGNDIENGEIPVCEMERVNQMVEDIAYNNAKKFFQF